MVLAAKLNSFESKDIVSFQNSSLKKARITSELEIRRDAQLSWFSLGGGLSEILRAAN